MYANNQNHTHIGTICCKSSHTHLTWKYNINEISIRRERERERASTEEQEKKNKKMCVNNNNVNYLILGRIFSHIFTQYSGITNANSHLTNISTYSQCEKEYKEWIWPLEFPQSIII